MAQPPPFNPPPMPPPEHQEFPEFYGIQPKEQNPAARWPIVYNCVAIVMTMMIYLYFVSEYSQIGRYYEPDLEEYLLLAAPIVVSVLAIFLLAFRVMAGWIILQLVGSALSAIFLTAVFDTIWRCVDRGNWRGFERMLDSDEFWLMLIAFGMVFSALLISLAKRPASLWKAGFGLRLAFFLLLGIAVVFGVCFPLVDHLF